MRMNWLGAAALALAAAAPTTAQTWHQAGPPGVGPHHQHLLDAAIDRERPERQLVVLNFDTNPFLVTKDGGSTWLPLGPGLKRTDLKHVYASPIGWWASLNKGGLMKYDETASRWVRFGLLDSDSLPGAFTDANGNTLAKRPPGTSRAPQLLAAQVNDLAFTNAAWYAATSTGLLVSRDRGTSWKAAGKDEYVMQGAQSLDASPDGSHIWAVAQRNLIYSTDGGAHWDAQELAFASAGNLRVHRLDDGNLLITSDSGLYVSKDAGREWNRADLQDLQLREAAYQPDAHSADSGLTGSAASSTQKP